MRPNLPNNLLQVLTQLAPIIFAFGFYSLSGIYQGFKVNASAKTAAILIVGLVSLLYLSTISDESFAKTFLRLIAATVTWFSICFGLVAFVQAFTTEDTFLFGGLAFACALGYWISIKTLDLLNKSPTPPTDS